MKLINIDKYESARNSENITSAEKRDRDAPTVVEIWTHSNRLSFVSHARRKGVPETNCLKNAKEREERGWKIFIPDGILKRNLPEYVGGVPVNSPQRTVKKHRRVALRVPHINTTVVFPPLSPVGGQRKHWDTFNRNDFYPGLRNFVNQHVI